MNSQLTAQDFAAILDTLHRLRDDARVPDFVAVETGLLDSIEAYAHKSFNLRPQLRKPLEPPTLSGFPVVARFSYEHQDYVAAGLVGHDLSLPNASTEPPVAQGSPPPPT